MIREVESEKELQALIESTADTEKIRIWMFNSSEWITLNAFHKLRRTPATIEKPNLPKVDKAVTHRASPSKVQGILKKLAIAVVAIVAILLVYNFTKVNWSKASNVTITPERPANSPLLNIDSLIQVLEWSRGQKLDKVTRTNLRIRNTWPDRILLKLETERDTSNSGGTRFYDMKISLDNATGYQIDEGIVEYEVWNDSRVAHSDTIRFNNIGYTSPAIKNVFGEFKGDSISIKFLSIRSRSFNFCYSAEKESNYGNFNDRWFCK